MNARFTAQQSRVALAVTLSITAVAAAQGRPGSVRTETYFPTGERGSSVVLLERITPAEVRRGDEFTYDIRLSNLTRARIENVQLSEQFPATFRVKTITPQPARSEADGAHWALATLDGGASHVIQVVGSTDRPDELRWCATVTFTTVACSTTRVVEPRLALEKKMLPEVLLCDEIPVRLIVSNTGTGVARNVRVTDDLPAGLTTIDGKTGIIFDAGDLAAGQAREVTVVTRASTTGEFRNTAKAVDDSGLAAEASASTIVRKPVLTVTKTGPAMRYLGRDATFDITVRNDGDTPASNTVLTDAVPAGSSFVSADGGGILSGSAITWSLGALAPGASKAVSVTFRANQIGQMVNTTNARAICAEGSASATVQVKGIPAILLEVVDLADPVEIGTNETYEIIVTNQGSANDSNIVIECTLPPEEDYVSSTGPTNATVAGKTVRFAPLPSLAPRAKATYRVVVKGIQVGDVRFKVSMTSDQTDTPVSETESTHVY